MFKMIGLFARRPDMTHEAFVAYYEGHHVPLILRLLPRFDGYARNYVTQAADRERLGYDVVTEARFDTAEAFARVAAAMANAAIADAIAADESRFMDRERSHSFPVDVR